MTDTSAPPPEPMDPAAETAPAGQAITPVVPLSFSTEPKRFTVASRSPTPVSAWSSQQLSPA